MSFLTRQLLLLLVTIAWLQAGCLTTPLPVPPTIEPEAHPEHITIEDHDGGVLITGEAGAFEPPDSTIRVSYGDEPIDSLPPQRAEVVVGDDGSFQGWVMGGFRNRYFIEILLEDEDLFVMAITGDIDDSPRAIETEAGPDRDGDGSPDEIDCAPDDETLGGRRCP